MKGMSNGDTFDVTEELIDGWVNELKDSVKDVDPDDVVFDCVTEGENRFMVDDEPLYAVYASNTNDVHHHIEAMVTKDAADLILEKCRAKEDPVVEKVEGEVVE